MLSKTEFDVWSNTLGLSCQTQEVIQRIRSSEPSRNVGGGSKNVFGRYPSRKMGVTIQFESHKVELPFIFQLEHNEDVLEFYDQPPAIKLDYQSKHDRRLGVLHTPDFFVIRKDSAGWEECKSEEQLKKLAEKSPHRYIFSEEKGWYCPPGEHYANSFGLYYHLRSDAEINWNLQRNFVFLEDYLRSESLEIDRPQLDSIIRAISEKPGITLNELLSLFLADSIYTLIAQEQIYVDLSSSLLAEPNQCNVFSDSETAQAYALMVSSTSSREITSPGVNLTAGASILWDGKALSIVHIGTTEIILRGEQERLIQLRRAELETLVWQGKITSPQVESHTTVSSEAWNKFYQASPEDQTEALRRYEVIQPYLEGQKRDNETTSARTIRDWKAKYLAAQEKYGCGYLGLLSHRKAKGNRQRKLPDITLQLMEQFIAEDYETLKQKSKWSVYCSLVDICEQKGAIAPSYKTFSKEIQKHAGYKQTLKRKGRRAAYPQSTFYWELSRTTPRHGDRPFEIGHIDHTQLDVELVCSHTGRSLRKPWVTFLIDGYSRRLLAVYLSFDSASYRACLMVLRLCVQRYGRLPQTIVVDNGAEFHSTYFETLLATFECTKKHRPAAKGRFGSVCERLFGTNNSQFIHNLMGNTQITCNVRQVTKSVNPKNQAIWTLGVLYEYLSQWAYEVYDRLDHPSLGQTPREAFITGIANGGGRTHRLIPYDENFKILTLPTTSSGKAKVQTSRGVKINYVYYWSNLFRNPEIENTSVPVRYDPFNASIAYAFVQGQWVECISQYYAEFQGRSEKELRLATSELRNRHRNNKKSKISAKKLANFLSSVEAQEVLLEQRLHDAEAVEVFRVIDGGKPTPAHMSSKVTDITSARTSSPAQSELQPTTQPNLPEELVVYEEF
ncbi:MULTISPECIES: TnsA endonuclease N-terminal domain-containing protein [unclassified Roseofilum]|uniref:TnsA endonuclease N-terminal domain-containing protein n=1 Tax=unclassified Roseofilum TaxID=2620099 RepID=UPI000E8D6EA9|nr:MULTISPECIES: DDE-type integrase/transposase/recombinase [unclassified Roseofilum]MBP0011405.1 DDE-type integrase/transposase/recombinase [Roseofilum sp. Belize Diploria]MBP0035116.1 DDE-type integrase/transposase/recombinase [Roseofilum sp. Belize BBD 4]HBQ99296.1 integrase [Cyanobacteria bacterium UBA11691]